MTKSRSTKKALVASVISLAICLAMLIGSTFAWFTDSVTSGNNRVVAGNLDLEMQYKDKNGNWQDVTDATVFGDDILWEPGVAVYKEFKVINNGSLALKYGIGMSADYNFVVETSEDGYVGTWKSLGDRVQLAVYRGTYDELVAEVEDARPGLSGRDVITAAFEEGLLEFDIFDTRPFFTSALAPAGNYIGEENGTLAPVDEIVFEDGLYSTGDDEYTTVTNVTDTEYFTVVAYWVPNLVVDFWEDGTWVLNDNDYNLKNGWKASAFTAMLLNAMDDDDIENYEFTEDDVTDSLFINFDIFAYAGQVPYESDSFGVDYDENADYREYPPTTGGDGVLPPVMPWPDFMPH